MFLFFFMDQILIVELVYNHGFNPIHVDWIGLHDGLGLIEFFLTHHGRFG